MFVKLYKNVFTNYVLQEWKGSRNKRLRGQINSAENIDIPQIDKPYSKTEHLPINKLTLGSFIYKRASVRFDQYATISK
jgi:hypothetical protein